MDAPHVTLFSAPAECSRNTNRQQPPQISSANFAAAAADSLYSYTYKKSRV